jgi:hypothetical protein
MKIKYEANNITYWIDLIKASISKTDPGYVAISNIHGM